MEEILEYLIPLLTFSFVISLLTAWIRMTLLAKTFGAGWVIGFIVFHFITLFAFCWRHWAEAKTRINAYVLSLLLLILSLILFSWKQSLRADRLHREAMTKTLTPAEHFDLGKLILIEKEAEAIIHLRKAVEGSPESIDYAVYLSRIYRKKSQFKLLLEILEPQLPLSEELPESVFEEVYCLLEAANRAEGFPQIADNFGSYLKAKNRICVFKDP